MLPLHHLSAVVPVLEKNNFNQSTTLHIWARRLRIAISQLCNVLGRIQCTRRSTKIYVLRRTSSHVLGDRQTDVNKLGMTTVVSRQGGSLSLASARSSRTTYIPTSVKHTGHLISARLVHI